MHNAVSALDNTVVRTKRAAVPFSGGIYGKRSPAMLPYSGGIYGKRAASATRHYPSNLNYLNLDDESNFPDASLWAMRTR